jgi:membrane protease YdiL (CAAX protease family)
MIDPERGGNPGPYERPAPDGILPAEDVFLEIEAAPAVTPPEPVVAATIVPRRPGPGIWESIAWMTGVHVAQLAAGAAAALFLTATFVATTGSEAIQQSLTTTAGFNALTAEMGKFFTENIIFLIAAAQLATVVFGLAAIRLRVGRAGLSRLGWQIPSAGHGLMIVLLVLPLWLLCSKLQSQMFELFPASHEEMTELMKAMSGASLPALLFVIGAGPALGEELIFRGLIGRGLLARWGFAGGVLITSVLFGIMHVNPAQAIGVIPLGIVMHFLYFTTRSFWAPIALHLANNALSVGLLKLEDDLPFGGMLDDSAKPPMHLFIVSAAMVTAIALLLWQTRVQYRLADGSIWNPGYVSAEAPPAEAGARPVRQDPRFLLLAGSMFNSLGFAAVLWRLAAAS